MLILAATTDSIEVVTGQAVTVDTHSSYIDCTNASPPVAKSPGRTNKNITTATTTTGVVPAPSGTDLRTIQLINIRNKHASASVDITVQFNQNGTIIELYKVTLRAQETLIYSSELGTWYVLSVAAAQFRTVKLAADQSNSTATLTEVTGMSQTTGLGTFVFQYFLIYQSGATTTGVRFSVNHTGTVTSFVANEYFGAGTTASSDAPDQDMVAAGAQVTSQFAARAKSTLGWGTTLSVDTANADMFVEIVGIMTVSADGSIALWHGSETTAISTIKAGSSLILTRTGD